MEPSADLKAYLYIKALLQPKQINLQIYKALEIHALNAIMQELLPLVKQLLAANQTSNLL